MCSLNPALHSLGRSDYTFLAILGLNLALLALGLQDALIISQPWHICSMYNQFSTIYM